MKRLALLTVLAGCGGSEGVLSLTLTTAPGSHILDDVSTLRVTVTNPMEIRNVERSRTGSFDLSLDLDATGESTSILVAGVDSVGTVLAVGATPRFPLGPLNGKIVIYMASPDTVAAAPVALDPPRAELGAGALSYGALFAGGRLATGAPSDGLSIYNAFDHSIVTGLPLPGPRADAIVGIGANGIAYIFGGTDESGAAADNLWRFDTAVAPAGQYTDFGAKTGFARAGELAIPIGDEHFLITGTPVADMFGLGGTLTAKTDLPSLPPAGASLIASDGVLTSIFASAAGVVRFRAGAFSTVDAPMAARDGATVTALSNGKVVVACGGAGLIRIDAATLATERIDSGVLPMSGCATAATADYFIIAGGTLADSSISSTVEVYDALTLTLLTTQPLVVPRTGAQAVPLPNGQILIAGGIDATGAAIPTIELFTPAN